MDMASSHGVRRWLPGALFLVVERELRVHARYASTYWIRLAAAATLAVVIGSILGSIAIATRAGVSMLGVGTGMLGEVLFQLLTQGGFWGALLLGCLTATDALAREQRDGTLGLLFLTPLSPLEVVLGKLFATLWRTLQVLVATLPFLAFALLFGAIRPTDVAALFLALANGLFWTLAVSLAASAFCRDWLRAFLLAATILVASILAPLIIEEWGETGPLGPLTAFRTLTHTHPFSANHYWESVGWVQLQAWLWIALATWRVRRGVRERPTSKRASAEMLQRDPAKPVPATPATPVAIPFRRRRPVRERPMLWLAERDPWMARVVNFATLLLAVLVPLALWVGIEDWRLPLVGLSHALVALAIMVLTIAQSTRVFAQSAQNGVLELLTISGVGPREMVAEQFRYLVRVLAIPVLASLVFQALQIRFTWAQFQTMMVGNGVQNLGPGLTDMIRFQVISAVFQLVVLPCSLTALSWLGMLMALMTHQTSKAFLLTLGLGWFAPGLVIILVSSFSMPLATMKNIPMYWGAIASGVVSLVVYGGLWFFARRYVYARFPELVLGGFSFALRTTPARPRAVGTPPPLAVPPTLS